MLPVVSPKQPGRPLVPDTVAAGLAYVGKPVPLLKLQPEDVAAFEDEVRKSGARPRGPLLGRLENPDTFDPDRETIQFIQPIVAP
jgi:hypothetical protein